VSGMPAVQLASINTFNRGVFRAFIQMHNRKIYDRLQEEIIEACIVNANKYRLSPILVLSLIQVESEFNINATSPKGAVGLTQINPSEWLEVLVKKNIVTSISDCYDPRKNVEAGCFILRYYLDETQNFDLALDRYLGIRSQKYRDDVYKMVHRILMLGITSEIHASYRSIDVGSDAKQKWN
jgi:soluble lytic murein transglycosylase-like protein